MNNPEEQKDQSSATTLGTFPRFLHNDVFLNQEDFEVFVSHSQEILQADDCPLPDRLFALFLWEQANVAAKMSGEVLPQIDSFITTAINFPKQHEELKAGLLRGIFLGFLETAGQGSFLAPIMYMMKTAFGFGKVHIGGLQEILPVAQVFQTSLSSIRDAIDVKLSEHLHMMVENGLFLKFKSIFHGVCFLLVSAPIADFFVRATLLQKSDSNPEKDFSRGFQIFQNNFSPDSQAIAHLFSSGAFAILFESLMVRQPVVHSLVSLGR